MCDYTEKKNEVIKTYILLTIKHNTKYCAKSQVEEQRLGEKKEQEYVHVLLASIHSNAIDLAVATGYIARMKWGLSAVELPTSWGGNIAANLLGRQPS